MAYIVVFVLMSITDMMWAYYIQKTSEGKPFTSALSATALLLVGGLVVVSYTENHMMLIPASLGSFVGTYATVWYGRKK